MSPACQLEMAPSLILRGRSSKVALHFMSDKELSRVEILRDLTAGRLTVSAASELMGLECRQVLRLTLHRRGAIWVDPRQGKMRAPRSRAPRAAGRPQRRPQGLTRGAAECGTEHARQPLNVPIAAQARHPLTAIFGQLPCISSHNWPYMDSVPNARRNPARARRPHQGAP